MKFLSLVLKKLFSTLFGTNAKSSVQMNLLVITGILLKLKKIISH
jgi:hypothetical protein